MLSLAKNNNKIKIISNSNNEGPIYSRNLAIGKAQGKYIAFLDADDFWLPDKLLIQIKLMEETKAVLTFTDYRFISEDGFFIGNRLRGPQSVGFSLHHMTRYLGCLTIIINHEICNDFLFPEISSDIRAEDFIAWSNVIKKYGPALRCNQDLSRYAVVLNSRSSNIFKNAKSVWLVYKKIERLNFITSIFYFIFYVFFTLFKRVWFNPYLKSHKIDGLISNTYILKK